MMHVRFSIGLIKDTKGEFCGINLNSRALEISGSLPACVNSSQFGCMTWIKMFLDQRLQEVILYA